MSSVETPTSLRAAPVASRPPESVAPTSRVGTLVRLALCGNVALLLAAVWIDPRQRAWLDALERHVFSPRIWEAYGWFMERSLFDDGVFGGSDVGVLYVLACLVVWLALTMRAGFERYVRRRPAAGPGGFWHGARRFTGFVTLTGLVCGVFAVHGLKTLAGRARPGRVFESPELFTDWFRPGADFLSGAASSFPSGHTGAVMLLVTLPYGLRYVLPRVSVWLFVAVLAGAYAMALGRMIADHHWLSDTLASILVYLALVPVVERMALGRRPLGDTGTAARS